MEHYSTIKKNEIMSFAGKRKVLEIIMLSRISQSEKDENYMFSLSHMESRPKKK
jgi:hypothetical protein